MNDDDDGELGAEPEPEPEPKKRKALPIDPRKARLLELQEFGRLQLDAEDLAEILEVPSLEVLDTEERKALRRGSLMAEAEVRRSVLKMAKDGSGPAQVQYMKWVDRARGYDD